MKSASKRASNRFLLLYGSQTGQAEAIAEDIEKAAFDQGLVADRFCMSLTEKKFSLEDSSLVVIVVSTTGEGDPPDTAQKIWRRLKKTTLDSKHLKNLKYALLGLGDSNYGMFCNGARLFDKRLEELGAIRFYKTDYADDAKGLEIVVEPWIEGLWAALRTALHITEVPIQLTSKCVSESSRTINDRKVDLTNSAVLNKEKESASFTSSLNTDKMSSEVNINQVDAVGPNEAIGPNLRTAIEPLLSSVLSLPPVTTPIFKLIPTKLADGEVTWKKPGHILAISDVIEVPVISLVALTNHELVKKTLELCVDISETGFCYEPGDAFGVFTPNDQVEVDQLLKRLGLMEQSEILYKLTALPTNNEKRPVTFPKHIPPTFKIIDLFTHYCDIRAVLKKKFIRVLSTHCSNEVDKRRLEELSSREGGEDYTNFVVIPGISLLDILLSFPSCSPPVECLIEHMSPLLPRFYSAANSPLLDKNLLRFVFRVVEISAESGRQYPRLGISTGWFYKAFCAVERKSDLIKEDSLAEAVAKMDLNSSRKLKLFMRKNNHFHLPASVTQPMILIGPGTGIAPFIGFLEHRQCKLGETLGPIWLFFGCRHRDHDFIYRKRLEDFLANGVISKLLLSFSRDCLDGEPKYVQDNVWLFRADIVKMIDKNDAAIFICGDAKGMAKDVYETLIRSLADQLELSDAEARAYVRTMQDKKRYLTDVWI